MGWSPSPAIFHSLVSRVFQDLPVYVYINDILLGGRDKKTHHTAMEKILKILQHYGFHVNAKKVQYYKREPACLGFSMDMNKWVLNITR